MQPWWWRKKPTSMVKIMEWLPHFVSLQGQNWDEELNGVVCSNGLPIHPVRREYIYATKHELINSEYNSKKDFLNGQFDKKAKESDARNDKISYEFYGFGYVDKEGIVRSTEVGELIKEKKMTSDILLKQFLKIQFPSPIGQQWKGRGNIFPMEIFLKLINKFDYLNRLEVSFMFFCDDMKEFSNLEKAILEFRKKYDQLKIKNKNKILEDLFDEVRNKFYPNIKNNKSNTYISYYSDSFFRAIEYCGYFKQSGRGYNTKIRVSKFAKKKIEILTKEHNFVFKNYNSLEDFMEHFGNPFSVKLPWEKNACSRIEIIEDKMKQLNDAIKNACSNIPEFDFDKYSWIKNVDLQKLKNDEESLLKIENKIIEDLTTMNEFLFVRYFSKTKEVRNEILTRFDYILDKEDDAALWLECNTWKSLVAINGEHEVKRNFKIEEDLSPRSFAIGVGNTPDMELYLDEYVLIPEVSLMSGVKQWEHEGSSVIDHVLSKINEFENKNVYGIFVSERMNIRTIWQFFILNKTSWVGKPVPVIPLTIKQFKEIVGYVYDHELDIYEFNSLIKKIHQSTLDFEHFKNWEDSIPSLIKKWSNNKIKLAK